MTDWTEGYVADIGYTYGYYNELNPVRAKLAFLINGLVCPEFGTACELGFGQGLSANLHAAASVTRWYGTDFNPAQAGFAQEMAATTGTGACLYDEAFDEFAHRADLPEFDYIGLHGIWSWISDDNRRVIVDFIRRKLKVGGVLYISYNTQPGWAAFAPMRHLMTEHAQVLGAQGRGIAHRIDGAIDFAEKLLATEPAYAKANPQVGDRIKKLKTQSRHYLAHEYFNRDWHPMPFATMAQWLEPAKLQFACSANFLDHVEVINLTKAQQAFLAEIPDPMFRQSVRDFMINQQFRKDYWVKGARQMSTLAKTEALRRMPVALVTPRANVSLKLSTVLGEVSMGGAVYEPLLDALSDHKPVAIGRLADVLGPKGVSTSQLMEAITVLTGTSAVAPAQEDGGGARARKCTDKANAFLMSKARSDSDILYLASPVTGGGVIVGRVQQLFAQAVAQGHKQPQDWARSAWQVLASQGQRLVKDGKTLESPQDNLARLTEEAQDFADKQLGMLKALQVI